LRLLVRAIDLCAYDYVELSRDDLEFGRMAFTSLPHLFFTAKK